MSTFRGKKSKLASSSFSQTLAYLWGGEDWERTRVPGYNWELFTDRVRTFGGCVREALLCFAKIAVKCVQRALNRRWRDFQRRCWAKIPRPRQTDACRIRDRLDKKRGFFKSRLTPLNCRGETHSRHPQRKSIPPSYLGAPNGVEMDPSKCLRHPRQCGD